MEELLTAPYRLMEALRFTLYGITFTFWDLFLFGIAASIVIWFIRKLVD